MYNRPRQLIAYVLLCASTLLFLAACSATEVDAEPSPTQTIQATAAQTSETPTQISEIATRQSPLSFTAV